MEKKHDKIRWCVQIAMVCVLFIQTQFLPVIGDFCSEMERIQSIFMPGIYMPGQVNRHGWDKKAVNPEWNENDGATETLADTCQTIEPTDQTDENTDPLLATPSDVSQTMADVSKLYYPDGIIYSMDELLNREFLIANCYSIDSSTSVTDEELDVKTLLAKDLSIHFTSEEPKVLIYHTHGSETFSDSRPGVTEDTVIGVGDALTRILQEDYGIPVYHDRTVYDRINGVEDRSLAYDYASEGIDEILKKYPSIEVILDIHRDGVREDVRLVREIDGLPTAQIMFLNGVSRTNENGDIDYLYNPYKIDNLAFSLQMHLAGKEMYGDLMRRIYIRGYCFNLNKMARSSLIEVGAQTNTVEEAKNAMIPLGAILYKVLIAQE